MDTEINTKHGSSSRVPREIPTLVDAVRVLRRHGLVCFSRRIIRDAGPPIDRQTLAGIQSQCRAQLPEALIRLWSTSFGGTLDYRLRVDFFGTPRRIECTELFHSDSDGYHDIWGWIDDTRQQNFETQGAANFDPDGPLRYLPFAGHDWSSRVLIDVGGGPEHGCIYAFRTGTPGARGRESIDEFAKVADDLDSFFAQLYFERDPLMAEGDHDDPVADLRHIELALRSGNPSETMAARHLRRQFQEAHLDWREAVDAGQIQNDFRLGTLALEHAAQNDELTLVARLAELGCPLDRVLLGGGTLLDHALMHGALGIVEYCLSGTEFPIEHALDWASAEVSANLVERLLARGAMPVANLIHRCATLGNVETAQVLSLALALANRSGALELRSDIQRWIDGLEQRIIEESPSSSQRCLWRREADCFAVVVKHLAVGQAS